MGGHHVAVHDNAVWIAKKYGRALYNDPENLWWICASCNRKKTDFVYDSSDQLDDLQSSKVPEGQKMRGSTNIKSII